MARNTLIDFLEYNHREDLVSKVAKILAADLISSVKGGGNAIFSVPGGSTPGPIFDKLCEFDLDWKRVSIILNDERWVPETSERSNTKLLRERLLIKKASLATYISMYSDVLTPEVGIPKLQERIERNLPISVLLFGMGADMHTASLFPGGDNLEKALSSNAPTLLPMRAEGALEARITLTAQVLNRSRIKHLVIFGMGADMHTASLFPGGDNLEKALSSNAPTLLPMRAEGALEARITLTAQVLNRSRIKHLVIFGKEKRTALEKAIDLPNRLAPISAILPGASVHWAA